VLGVTASSRRSYASRRWQQRSSGVAMRVVQPWDEGIITEDNPDNIRLYLSRMEKQFDRIQLRLLDETYVSEVKPEDFPPHIKQVDLVLLTAAETDARGSMRYVISDEAARAFQDKLPHLTVKIIHSPYGFYTPPAEVPVEKIQLARGHRNLEALEEAARLLSDVVKVEPGFTIDSPFNDDREFGVYDSVEMTFNNEDIGVPLKVVFDRHNCCLLVFHRATNDPVARAWLRARIDEARHLA
jgi:hypothetical protein